MAEFLRANAAPRLWGKQVCKGNRERARLDQVNRACEVNRRRHDSRRARIGRDAVSEATVSGRDLIR